MTGQLRLYHDLAPWFTTLTPPEEYAEEANLYHQLFQQTSRTPIHTMLELGAGSGNNASHLKQHYQMTLTDISPAMLAESQKQNPECEHHVGDMRSLRLNQQFDAIFIHDSINYMVTYEDLRSAIQTAVVHCKSDGVIMIIPDYVRETFSPSTIHGGGDSPRSMRYLEWTWQAHDQDDFYYVDFSYLLREREEVTCVHDRHTCGLFSQEQWMSIFQEFDLTIQNTRSDILGDSGVAQTIFLATPQNKSML